MDFSEQQKKFGDITVGTPQPAAQPDKKKVGGLKGFAANLLPLILGGGGALAGSLAGPVGTAGGGAAGSALGEAAREKLLGENLNAKTIGIQSALGAVPGLFEGVSGGIKAARAGESVGASLIGQGAEKAGVEAAAESVPKKSILDKVAAKGSQVESRSGGYGIGEKIPGQEPLGFYDSAKINSNLKAEGIKAGSPAPRLQQVEDILNVKNKQLGNLVGDNSSNINLAGRRAIADKYLQTVEDLPGVDDTVRKNALSFAQNLKRQGTSDQALLNIKRGVDKDVISYIANPDAATTAKQAAGQAYRNVLRDELNTRIPGIESLNNSTHDLYEARGFLKGGAKVLSDQSQSAGGSLIGRALSSESAQGLKSKGGALLESGAEKLGGSVAPAEAAASQGTKLLPGLAKATFKQSLPRAAAGLFASGDAGQSKPSTALESLESGQNPPPGWDAETYANFKAANPGLEPTAEDTARMNGGDSSTDSSNPFSQESVQGAIMGDIQRTGGKNIAQLISLYNTFGKPEKQSTADKANDDNLNLANASLKSISQAFDVAGGGQGAPGLASHLPVVGQYLAPKAAAYNQTKIETATQLAKALTGSTRPAASVTQYYLHSLPNIEDRPEVAAQKLEFLRNDLKNRLLGSQGNLSTDDLANFSLTGAQ